VRAAQGEFAWAARLWGASETLRESMGTPLPPRERASYEWAVKPALTQYGEKAFAAAWAHGRLMTAEQVLDPRGPATIPAGSGINKQDMVDSEGQSDSVSEYGFWV
jgi:hypothetical protein